jgi:hypothetical protein
LYSRGGNMGAMSCRLAPFHCYPVIFWESFGFIGGLCSAK